MSPSILSAMPNRPHRVSSRAALTSPSLPLVASGNTSTNRIPPLPTEQLPRTLSSQRSMDVLRHDLPWRAQDLTIQTSLAQMDHPTAGPQLPQLLPSKPAPNRGVYNKLKNVKSFFRKPAAESDDDNDGFDTGRGADPSTNSEPGYSSERGRRPKLLQPSSSNTDTASLRSFRAAPSLAPSEYVARPRASSSKSRPQAMRNDHIKQVNRDALHLELGPHAPLLPNIPSLTTACSSREDTTPTRGNHGPSTAQKSFDLSRAAPHPGSKQITPRPSFSAPRVTTVSQAYARKAALKNHKADPLKDSPDNSRGHCDALVKVSAPRGRCSSSCSVASLTNQFERDVDTSAYGDDTSASIERLKYDRNLDDYTTESFEINLAQVKPTTACKLVLSQPANSSLAVGRGVSSAGSSVRSSSPSGFTHSGSNREDYMSPCSSLPSPQLPNEEFVNIRQIRQVMKGLQSLLEKIDPEAQDARDSTNRIPSDQQSLSSSNSPPNLRINHAEFLRMIKTELDR